MLFPAPCHYVLLFLRPQLPFSPHTHHSRRTAARTNQPNSARAVACREAQVRNHGRTTASGSCHGAAFSPPAVRAVARSRVGVRARPTTEGQHREERMPSASRSVRTVSSRCSREVEAYAQLRDGVFRQDAGLAKNAARTLAGDGPRRSSEPLVAAPSFGSRQAGGARVVRACCGPRSRPRSGAGPRSGPRSGAGRTFLFCVVSVVFYTNTHTHTLVKARVNTPVVRRSLNLREESARRTLWPLAHPSAAPTGRPHQCRPRVAGSKQQAS